MATRKTKKETEEDRQLEYFTRAALQIPYPVDHYDKTILVPKSDVEEAKLHLMIQHLCNRGYILEVNDEVERRDVFDPKTTPRIIREVDNGDYRVRDRFKIVSSDCELEIVKIEKEIITLHYTNRNKSDLPTKKANLDKVIENQYWLKLPAVPTIG